MRRLSESLKVTNLRSVKLLILKQFVFGIGMLLIILGLT